MLDQAWIFKQNGVVLWSKQLAAVKGSFVGGSVINHLIRTVLLEEKAGQAQAVLEKHVLRWVMANERDLVIVLVYNRAVYANITYVDELLQRVKDDFLAAFSREEIAGHNKLPYDSRFSKLLNEVETRARTQRSSASGKGKGTPQRQGAQQPQKPIKVEEDEDGHEPQPEDVDVEVDPADDEEGNGDEDEDGDGAEGEDGEGESVDAARARLAAKMRGRGGSRSRGRRPSRGGAPEGPAPEEPISGETGKRGPKKPTVWNDGTGRITQQQMDKLDRSKAVGKGGGAIDADDSAVLRETRATFLPSEGETPEWEVEEEVKVLDHEEEGAGGGGAAAASSKPSFFSRFLSQITGNSVLEESDLDPVLTEMKDMLVGKNVALEIAQNICDSVRTSLVGKKLPSLTRVKTLVREALEQAIVRVLTPKRSTDVLREIMAAKAAGRPYSIVFVGINGVGKSTSLSKVCYYLKSHGLKVLIAACDTFRSGAVEQLKVHARCLEVELFDKGYHKDPSAVARDALKEAREMGFDVVLIDTAGRMQNKEPLMRALAKLVSDNEPDLVLFVGEALVGNDGIDQLSMFDQALANYSPPGRQHKIDGIVLTKFDTVDEKVGAALSMCYKTGQPILFVGTGQKYTHLKKLNVGFVINCLFK